MLGRIIVAYDGSRLARAAFQLGVDLASTLRRPMLAVYTVEPLPPPPVLADPMVAIDPGPMSNYAEDLGEQRAWAEREMDDLHAKARARGVSLEGRIEQGSLREVLVEMANADDLIAVGKKGRFRESGVGSMTRGLVRASPCPTLVVSEDASPIDRLVSVFDGTAEGKRAMIFAGMLTKETGWPLDVVALPSDGQTPEEAVARTREALPEGCPATVTATAKSHDCAHAVEEALAQHSSGSLVVLGAYGESWLAELLFGSTAPRVLKRVKAPIILVH
ncbi:MAG: universal stress protein [Phycisphaeraceae bacterium]|nr:universal stress protein [Phycisphaeraceae bacterium]